MNPSSDPASDVLLRVESIYASYSGVPVLRDVSLEIHEGEVVALIGANGAGKTTLLRSITNLKQIDQGKVYLDGRRIDHTPPHDLVKMGISHVLEGRHLFGKLTVKDNLDLGLYSKSSEQTSEETLYMVYQLFPILKARSRQRSETLSGGEQQMLAIARGLMSNPRILMLDEPSLGLMPKYVQDVFTAIARIKEQGMTILLVEQDIQRALRISDRGYVLQTGKIMLDGAGEDLLSSDLVKRAYLGI